MKSVLVSATLLCAIGSVSADDLRDNVGIGLGTMLFKGQTGLVSQVSAATTNGSFGNQTFAITTGTSEARKFSGFVQNKALRDFVHDNMDTLAKDMAAGSGESLDTLAELMAVPAERRGAFASTLQSGFGEVFTSAAVSDAEVVENLRKLVPEA